MEKWVTVLEEIQEEYPVNINIDTVIAQLKARIKELNNQTRQT